MNKKILLIGLSALVVLVLLYVFVLDSSLTGGVVNQLDGEKITLYLFYGEGCGYCAKEKAFLSTIEDKYPSLEIKSYETWFDKNNQDLFEEIAKIYGITIQRVPTTFIGEKSWVGFSEEIGKQMEDYIIYCIENSCSSPGNILN